jgi:guanylate cyclase
MGIDCGPAVAGVIGNKKFIHDMRGDTVNSASRMESHGRSGVIQIAEGTCNLIKDNFLCEARGMIGAKGIGNVNIRHIQGRI